MKSLRRLALAVAALALVGSAAVAPANAAGGPSAPTNSSADGIVTVCPGVSYNSSIDAAGNPLTNKQVATLAKHMEYRCAHPGMKNSNTPPQTKSKGKLSGPGSVTPNASVLGGDLTAFLYMSTDGNWLNYFTQAVSMPSGDKTLTCEIAWNNGAWSDCGDATGTGSTLSTRNNQSPCPPTGNHIEVTAWLDYGGAQYWDSATLDT